MPESRELHLSEERLLLHADGELPEEQRIEVSRHLECCWQCRARYLDLQQMIHLIVEARQRVLNRRSSAEGWIGLAQRIAQHEKVAGQDGSNWLLRSSRWLRHRVRFAGIGAAAIALVFWLSVPPNNTTAQPAQLLNKAQAFERSRVRQDLGELRRMRLSVRRSGSLTAEQVDYEIWIRKGGARLLRVNATSGGARRLVEEARTAFAKGLEWDRPVSADVYERWRSSVEVTEELVEKRPNRELAIVTRAKPSKERIHEAELVVEEASGRSVETGVRVGDQQFAVRELGVEMLPKSESDPLSTSVPSAANSAAMLQGSDLEAIEMALRHGLHQLGGDLGEPIEIYRNAGNQICLEALGLPAGRLGNIQQLARRFPEVQLLTQPVARRQTCPGCESIRVESMAITGERQRDVAIVNHLGTEAAFERFSRNSVRRMDEVLNRAYALHRLAVAYPSERENRLPPIARDQLSEMLRMHRISATAELDQLRASLPWSPEPGYQVGAAESWQQAVIDLRIAAQKADRSLKTALGFLAGSPNELSLPESLTSARQALRNLESFSQ